MALTTFSRGCHTKKSVTPFQMFTLSVLFYTDLASALTTDNTAFGCTQTHLYTNTLNHEFFVEYVRVGSADGEM